MPLVGIFGAKGGVGVSLLATNLALRLQRVGGAILVDLNIMSPCDDLLLDLAAEGTWGDLLPVAGELTLRHLELASVVHSGGLRLLCPPLVLRPDMPGEQIRALARALARHRTWVILDMPPVPGDEMWLILGGMDATLLVTTPDPLALRGARRFVESMPQAMSARTSLIVNQLDRFHPASAEAIRRSLGCPLVGSLPRDPQRVADQVNYGKAVVTDRGCQFAREIDLIARRLTTQIAEVD